MDIVNFRGVLTPEEFVGAGDLLVHTCPTWAWSAGEPAQAKSYLPVDKQCLITRGGKDLLLLDHGYVLSN